MQLGHQQAGRATAARSAGSRRAAATRSAAMFALLLSVSAASLTAQTREPSRILQYVGTRQTSAAAISASVPILYESTKLLASDGADDDRFGWSVSVSGDVAVVGARAHDDNGDASGAAYIYRWNGSAWIEEQELLASNGTGDDRFGTSATVFGDVAIIGALGRGANGAVSGSAYVFRWNGSTWVQAQELLPSDGAAGDGFGSSVSVFGDTAIVGAVGDDDGAHNAGSAYVFVRDGSEWVHQQKLVPLDPQTAGRFGASVSVSGDVAVIGAHANDENGHGSGAAYVFRRDGSAWFREQKLLASDGAEGDRFGASVSVSGGSIVVGAPLDDVPFSEAPANGKSGSAYVFLWNGAAWIEVKKLLPSDGRDGDLFGGSVAISDGVIVVGAPLDGYATQHFFSDDLGSAYLFRWDGAAWREAEKFLASDAARNNQLGVAVAVSGNIVVAGAKLGDNGDSTGSAYVFEIEGHIIDCDENGIDDADDIADCIGDLACADCNSNGLRDGCEVDCNSNQIPDGCDIASCEGDPACGDCDLNGVPDGCQQDADGDELIDICDACSYSQTSKTIVIGQCNTGVSNILFDDGCTMADALSECDQFLDLDRFAGRRSPSDFLTCVTERASVWKKDRTISDRGFEKIVSCAAKTDPGRIRLPRQRGKTGTTPK